MRFLITGALGAVGAWTTRSLVDRGHDVVAFDLPGDGHRLSLALDADQTKSVERVEGDITDLEMLEATIRRQRVDGVIHLAALQVPFVRADPARGAAVNVLGTVNVLEAARRREIASPVVFASSIAALGPTGGVHDPGTPSTLYGVYKRANELTARRYFDDFGLSSIGLRPHTVYGPGRDQGVTSAPTTAMVAAAAGTPYEIPYDAVLQMQYAPDVGEAFALASLLSRRGAEVHNLDGEAVATGDLAGMINEAADSPGLISAGSDTLPLVGAVDGRSSVELLGTSVMRPLREGVTDALSRFRVLLSDGRVPRPAP